MSSSKTRREFLITAGTGMAVGVLASRIGQAQFPPGLRVRRNVVTTAAQKDLESLRKGVNAMKNLFKSDRSDPRGWVSQAFIHGNCTQFTFCQHGNWFFPPWHRSFIYYFEQLIAFFSEDDTFALPYWDWSRTISVPASFYGEGNPLDDDISLSNPPSRPVICSSAPTAGRGVAQTTQLTQADLDTYVGTKKINDIQSNPDYATYGGAAVGTGALEATPHNFIHRWAGGRASGGRKISNMVQTFSPMDPIFWMHHCNIDRLYSNWLSRGFKPPIDKPAWRDKSFNDFYDKDKKKVGSEFTCGMTVNSEVMRYVYDTVLTMPAALATQRRTSGREELKASIAATKATARAGVLSFVTDAAPPMATRQVLTAAAIGADEHVVRLIIHNVKKPKEQNTSVHVFIGSNVTADTPITAPGYVGSFTFFEGEGEGGGHQHDGEHHHGRTVLFNASEALRDLYGDTSLPEGANLTVSLVTRPLSAGSRSFATVEEIRPDRVQIDVVDLDA